MRYPVLFLFCLLTPLTAGSQGTVYLVLGSDTAIWDGMDTGNSRCHYSLDLFINPQRNAYKVMDPAFRARFKDSYGQTVRMTWWMMAGNIFETADNTDVPLANTMTLYLMKKYHGENVVRDGDELSLHYHTFTWTDYNRDGKYYWNQAHSFEECRQDFDLTLAQFLLEEEVFPVAFRSGWHYMDNGWQQYLNTLLPYTLHNDYPNVRMTAVEPIDNVFDWSKAPAAFVPFVPSRENYQVPGEGHGWNTRSIHMGNVTASLMNGIFAQAAQGIDQVPCFWAHLPEEDFLTNIARMDSLARLAAAKYPAVKFRYCTATEAMQRWRKTADLSAPALSVQQSEQGGQTVYDISVDEPVFQAQPFLAVKDLYERYTVIPCQPVGPNLWRGIAPLPASYIAKAGVAVTDTAGNQSIRILRNLPDDQFIDNTDASCTEERGAWSTSSLKAWGVDSRLASLGAADTARVRWTPLITRSGRYNVFFQVPAVANMAGNLHIRFLSNGSPVDSTFLAAPPAGNTWVFAGSPAFTAGAQNSIVMEAAGAGQAGKVAVIDVIKISALVRERQLVVSTPLVDLGSVSEGDTAHTTVRLSNQGTGLLRITGVAPSRPGIRVPVSFPLDLQAMQTAEIPLTLTAPATGIYRDSVLIASDDPLRPEVPVVLLTRVEPYFALADNDDSSAYQEAGAWSYSNAQAFGKSSRYALLSNLPDPGATFTMRLRQTAAYDVQEIVPKTTNAATRALYAVSADNRLLDTVVIDQNASSGTWVTLGRYSFDAGTRVTVTVRKAAGTAGDVLRADAVKVARVVTTSAGAASPEAGYPAGFLLSQNFPNPFNPSTTIRFGLPARSHVVLTVSNMLGQRVAQLVEGECEAGYHEIRFDASGLASGVYFYQLRAEGFVATKRFLLLR